MLVHAAVVTTVGLAAAVSGATVALHLAVVPSAGDDIARPGAAATRMRVPATLVDKPTMPAGAPAPSAQTMPVSATATASDSAAAGPADLVPRSVSPAMTERELTFAWGYAQRHPGTSVHAATTTEATAAAPKIQPRPSAARQRLPVAQREAVGLARSTFLAGFDRDRHQALGYAEERPAIGFGVFNRPSSSPSGPRRHSSFQYPNHEQTRS